MSNQELQETVRHGRKTVGLIRVVTLTDADKLNAHGALIERHVPRLSVISRCIPDQPYGIHDDATEHAAIPKIIDLADAMVRDDHVEALIISCAADPAVGELKARLSVPVIGAGRSSALFALSRGDKIGMLGITSEPLEALTSVLGDRLVGTAKPEGVANTIDLLEPRLREHAFSAARSLVELGAEAIAISCTGFATIGIIDDLAKACGVPVVDPVRAAGVICDYWLNERSGNEA